MGDSQDGKSAQGTHDSRGGAPAAPCVFLGAGASAWAGYFTFLSFPTMFWPTSRDPAVLRATDRELSLLRTLNERLVQEHKPRTLDNFLWRLTDYHECVRSVFADPELRARFAGSTVSQAEMREISFLVGRVREHICELTIDHYRSAPKSNRDGQAAGYKDAVEFYEGLLEASPSEVLPIFTTNYDLLPEYLLSDARAWSVTSREKRYTFENGFLGFDRRQPRDGYSDGGAECPPAWKREAYKAEGRTVQVYRLHGCVSWFYGERLDSDVYLDTRELTEISQFYDRLCVMYPGKEQRAGRDPHAFAFERLYETCLTATIVLFIGFAFQDDDVIRTVFGALRRRADPVPVVVVDPALHAADVIWRINQSRQNSTIPMLVPEEDQIAVIRETFPGPGLLEQVLSHCGGERA